MYNNESRKIIIPGKKNKNKGSSVHIPIVSLEDFTEIKCGYLRHLHNSYIKYTDTISNITYSGGFIVSVDTDSVSIRLPGKKDEMLSIVQFDTSIFYVKNTNLNYLSIKSLILERNKLDFEKNKLQQKMLEFEEYKTNFF